MRSTKFLVLSSLFSLLACSDKGQPTPPPAQGENPFFAAYNTPFEVPAFDRIQNAHYKPAFLEGFKQHKAEIEAIANSTEAPNFENSIAAMDAAGLLLDRVSNVFYNLNSANTDEEMQALATEIAPLSSAHFDEIYLNEALFKRVETVWNNRETAQLNPEQLRLLEKTYKGFVRSGAKVENKTRLKEINAKLSVLTVKFGQNVLAETNAYKLIIDKEADLKGLPASVIEAAAKASGEPGKWAFTLHNASLIPFLQYAENRELRRQIWEAYKSKAGQGNAHDNSEIVRELVALRAEKAQLLGYPNHAEFVLEERMAKNLAGVNELLEQLWQPALQAAAREEASFQDMVKKEGKDFQIQAYDWRFYEEKVRLAKYNLDAEAVRPYFSLDKVREGIFLVSQKLFGLQFKARPELPVYHPEVVAYEVLEANGEHVGILYMDMHPRASKGGGAWMTSFREQSRDKTGKRLAPVISIVCNFSPATDSMPSLLSFDEVTTFFHEFGHALHGLLSDVQYKSLAGTSVPTDFVELPSQIMENWATEPEVMRLYAKHYKTGEVIPDSLIQKLEASGTFGQGFATVEYLASTFLDLAYHSRKEGFQGSVQDFETQAMKAIGLPSSIIPRHSSLYFGHIFAGGYSAGYYSYIWSGVLDTDAFQAFKETQLFNPEKALALRREILEKGGSEDAMKMYVNFRGAKPSIKALLRKRGLS